MYANIHDLSKHPWYTSIVYIDLYSVLYSI